MLTMIFRFIDLNFLKNFDLNEFNQLQTVYDDFLNNRIVVILILKCKFFPLPDLCGNSIKVRKYE